MNDDFEYDNFDKTCAVCGVIIDRYDDEEFTCNDIRCQRTWGDRVEEYEENKRARMQLEQEY